MPDDIIGLIDGAIEDWETGPDAMRWSPDPPKESERRRYTPESVAREMAALHRMLHAPRPPEPDPVHPRVVDEHRAGYRLVPFIGGSRDGSVLRLPMDPGYAWNVVEPPSMTFESEGPLFAEPGYTTYTVRRVWLDLPAMWGIGLYHRWTGRALVCAHGDPGEGAMRSVLERALGDGWKPWLYEDNRSP